MKQPPSRALAGRLREIVVLGVVLPFASAGLVRRPEAPKPSPGAAGGGALSGMTQDSRESASRKVVRGPVNVHDLNATVPRLTGNDHTRLTFRFQGRDFRTADAHARVSELLIS